MITTDDTSSARRCLEAVAKKFGQLNPDFEVHIGISSFRPGVLMEFSHRRDPLKSITFTNNSPAFAVQELVQTVLKEGPGYGLVVTEKVEPKTCPACGSMRVFIRGRHPGNKQREVCPTCVVEKLETLYADLFCTVPKQV